MPLWWLGLFLEGMSMLVILGLSKFHLKKFFAYRIAVNIEHSTERIGLFTLIAFGESVVAIIWDSESPHFSIPYLAAILGLIISVSLKTAYFGSDTSSRHFVHAIRRHVLTGIIWQYLHLFLTMFIIAFGASLSVLVKFSEYEQKTPDPILRCIFVGGLFLTNITLALLNICHKTIEPDPVSKCYTFFFNFILFLCSI